MDNEQFYQMMTRLRAQSRAASSTDKRLTEMSNGVLISRYAVGEEKEPEIIDLQEYARSAGKAGASVSVSGINKTKVIHDFIKSNGRY